MIIVYTLHYLKWTKLNSSKYFIFKLLKAAIFWLIKRKNIIWRIVLQVVLVCKDILRLTVVFLCIGCKLLIRTYLKINFILKWN